MNQDNKPSQGNIISTPSCDNSKSAPFSDEGLMRRDWLKNVMLGGVGLGLFGIPMPTLAEEQTGMKCPRIIRVSKNLEARIDRYNCESCLCGKERVSESIWILKGNLSPIRPAMSRST